MEEPWCTHNVGNSCLTLLTDIRPPSEQYVPTCGVLKKPTSEVSSTDAICRGTLDDALLGVAWRLRTPDSQYLFRWHQSLLVSQLVK